MAMKGHSAFAKATVSLKPHHTIVYVIFKTLFGESYSSPEIQSVYSLAPTNLAILHSLWVPSKSILRMVLSILQGDCPGVYLFVIYLLHSCVFKKCSLSSEALLLYFLSFPLVWFYPLPILPIFLSFLLAKMSNSFYNWQLYSYHCFLFPPYHYKQYEITFLHSSCINTLFSSKSPVLFEFLK